MRELIAAIIILSLIPLFTTYLTIWLIKENKKSNLLEDGNEEDIEKTSESKEENLNYDEEVLITYFALEEDIFD